MGNLSSYNFIYKNTTDTIVEKITISIADYNFNFLEELQSKINSNKTDTNRNSLATVVLNDYYNKFISIALTDPIESFISSIQSQNIFINKFERELSVIINNRFKNASLVQFNNFKSDINFFNKSLLREVYDAESKVIESIIKRASLDLNLQRLSNSQQAALINSNLLTENKLNTGCDIGLKRIIDENYKWFNK